MVWYEVWSSGGNLYCTLHRYIGKNAVLMRVNDETVRLSD